MILCTCSLAKERLQQCRWRQGHEARLELARCIRGNNSDLPLALRREQYLSWAGERAVHLVLCLTLCSAFPRIHSTPIQPSIITFSFDLYDICIIETHAIAIGVKGCGGVGIVMRLQLFDQGRR